MSDYPRRIDWWRALGCLAVVMSAAIVGGVIALVASYLASRP